MGAIRSYVLSRRVRRLNRDRIWLIAIELFVGLMAVPCGILLVVNGLGMSRDVLKDSPFDGFLVPGLLLTFVVGGSLLVAALLAWVGHPRARLVSLGAGCILLGWIVIEAAMVWSGRGLQVAILALALLILGLAWHGPRNKQDTRVQRAIRPLPPKTS
jgi:hypothetical protein